MRRCYVYILANRRYGVLYVGVTNNLIRRIFEHQQKLSEGFTKTHGVTRLVYFEEYSSALEHFPAKWEPVRRRKCDQIRNLERVSDSIESGRALEARARERNLKRWRRAWKLKLVNEFNPDWRDLAKELAD